MGAISATAVGNGSDPISTAPQRICSLNRLYIPTSSPCSKMLGPLSIVRVSATYSRAKPSWTTTARTSWATTPRHLLVQTIGPPSPQVFLPPQASSSTVSNLSPSVQPARLPPPLRSSAPPLPPGRRAFLTLAAMPYMCPIPVSLTAFPMLITPSIIKGNARSSKSIRKWEALRGSTSELSISTKEKTGRAA